MASPRLTAFRELLQVIGSALVYGAILFTLAIISAGAGDGTYVPFRVFSAPFGLIAFSAGLYGVPVLWLLAGGLLCTGPTQRARKAFVILMSCHYVGIIAVVATTPGEKWSQFVELSRTLSPGVFIVAAFLIYILGQFLLWRRFRHGGCWRNHRTPPSVV